MYRLHNAMHPRDRAKRPHNLWMDFAVLLMTESPPSVSRTVFDILLKFSLPLQHDMQLTLMAQQ